MKNIYILVLIYSFVAANIVTAQTNCINFNKYSNFIHFQENFGIEPLSTGGFITFGGQTYDSVGTKNYAGFVNRLDENGDTLWMKHFGFDDPTNYYGKTGLFPGVWYRCGSLLQDSIIIVAGQYQDTSVQEYYHYYSHVVRYNLDGDTLWSRKILLQDTSISVYAMMQYDNQSVIISGAYVPFNVSGNPIYNSRVFICKYSIDGTLFWRKSLPHPTGGNGFKMDKAANGDIIISGSVDQGWGSLYDPFLARLTSTGNLIWADSTMGGTFEDAGGTPVVLKNNNIVSFHQRNTSCCNQNFLNQIRCNAPNGTFLWEKFYKGFKFGGLSDGIELSDGGIIFSGGLSDSGYYNIKGYLMRTDANGDSLWTRTFGDTSSFQFFHDIAKACDGYVLTGASYPISPVGASYGWVVHTDTLGFVTTGIEQVSGELQLADLSIPVPNPASYITTVTAFVPDIPYSNITGKNDAYLYVFNLQGKQITSVPLTKGEQQVPLDVSNYTIGNYLMVMSINGYNAVTQKLMVVR